MLAVHPWKDCVLLWSLSSASGFLPTHCSAGPEPEPGEAQVLPMKALGLTGRQVTAGSNAGI